MKNRPFVIGISIVGLAILAGSLLHAYQERQARSQLMERKFPFAEVVALAMVEGMDELRKQGLIPPSSAPPVACSIYSCGGVREAKVAKDGSVAVVLSGDRQAGLEGKSILLVPSIFNGNVTWACRTNAPMELVPAKADNLPGLFRVECSPLT